MENTQENLEFPRRVKNYDLPIAIMSLDIKSHLENFITYACKTSCKSSCRTTCRGGCKTCRFGGYNSSLNDKLLDYQEIENIFSEIISN